MKSNKDSNGDKGKIAFSSKKYAYFNIQKKLVDLRLM